MSCPTVGGGVVVGGGVEDGGLLLGGVLTGGALVVAPPPSQPPLHALRNIPAKSKSENVEDSGLLGSRIISSSLWIELLHFTNYSACIIYSQCQIVTKSLRGDTQLLSVGKILY